MRPCSSRLHTIFVKALQRLIVISKESLKTLVVGDQLRNTQNREFRRIFGAHKFNNYAEFEANLAIFEEVC